MRPICDATRLISAGKESERNNNLWCPAYDRVGLLSSSSERNAARLRLRPRPRLTLAHSPTVRAKCKGIGEPVKRLAVELHEPQPWMHEWSAVRWIDAYSCV